MLILFYHLCSNRLELEHAALEKEYGRLPKKEELDQHIKDLGKTVEELKEEIDRVRGKG